MTKSERTREFILDTTVSLFNTKGYEGTSLSDLTACTGLTKGALYGNFENKEDIAKAAFQHAMSQVRKEIRKSIGVKVTYKAKLVALLEFYSAYVFDPPVAGGCPLMNAAIEADDHVSFMRKTVARELVGTVNFIAHLLEKGLSAGEFKKNIKPRELAYTFFCSIEGAIMYARVERSDEPIKIIVRHCKNILNEISK